MQNNNKKAVVEACNTLYIERGFFNITFIFFIGQVDIRTPFYLLLRHDLLIETIIIKYNYEFF